LLNFCTLIQGQFKDDERFSDLFLPRGKAPRLVSDLMNEFLEKKGIK